jgi:hypothetical protein
MPFWQMGLNFFSREATGRAMVSGWSRLVSGTGCRAFVYAVLRSNCD